MTISNAPLRLGLALANDEAVASSVEVARRAEHLGIDEVWVCEPGHSRGIFTLGMQIAVHTEHIGIGIGVVTPFWRHPTLLAMEAATLQEASQGRVKLGLGASLTTLRLHGEADDRVGRPRTAMIEAIRVVRGLLRGVDGVDGEVFCKRRLKTRAPVT